MNKKHNNYKNTFLTILFNMICIIISFACIFPLVWLIYSSFKTKGEFIMNPLSLPTTFQYENYIKAFQIGNLFVATRNSFLNVIVNVIVVCIASIITGYFFSRYDFKGKKFIYYTYLIGFLMPLYGLLVPVFIQFKMFNLINTRISLWFPYYAMQIPIAIFLVESFVKGIPKEIEEAAVIEGCSLWQIIWRIMFPLCRPCIATVAVLTSLQTWNEFGFAAVLIRDVNLRTISVALLSYTTGKAFEYTYMMAALVSASIPIILLYLFFSKQIIEGFAAAGAVKG